MKTGEMGVYDSFKKRLNITESGIVGFWDLVTKVLSYVSLLVIVLAVKKRWKKNMHEGKS